MPRDAALIMLPYAAHLPFVEHPAIVAAAVGWHLGGAWGGAQSPRLLNG
jgi:hypothetical protein